MMFVRIGVGVTPSYPGRRAGLWTRRRAAWTAFAVLVRAPNAERTPGAYRLLSTRLLTRAVGGRVP
jgi:hypothetical protein